MGCDYYIAKVLYIYCKCDKDYCVELYRDRGYYYCDLDTDNADNATKVMEYKKRMLTPGIPPMVLYDNGSFKNVHYENKYSYLVNYEIAKYHKNWNDIVKIVKVEERYERD